MICLIDTPIEDVNIRVDINTINTTQQGFFLYNHGPHILRLSRIILVSEQDICFVLVQYHSNPTHKIYIIATVKFFRLLKYIYNINKN